MKREALRKHSLYTVTWWYNKGLVDQQDYEWYCFLWRNSAPRFSDECQGYELPRPLLRYIWSHPGWAKPTTVPKAPIPTS